METKVEIIKCRNPNTSLPVCRECQRNGVSQDNDYESFKLSKPIMSSWVCDGYVSKREVNSLFD
jgi:hypothetical protein